MTPGSLVVTLESLLFTPGDPWSHCQPPGDLRTHSSDFWRPLPTWKPPGRYQVTPGPHYPTPGGPWPPKNLLGDTRWPQAPTIRLLAIPGHLETSLQVPGDPRPPLSDSLRPLATWKPPGRYQVTPEIRKRRSDTQEAWKLGKKQGRICQRMINRRSRAEYFPLHKLFENILTC